MGYHEIANDLRRGIKDGTYQVGRTLPKQRDLAERYGVNIGTIRRAIAVLARHGEVEPIRRRGTVVLGPSKMSRLGPGRYAKDLWPKGVVAFAADREASGLKWREDNQTQSVEKIEADSEVADAFGLEAGDEVYVRARLITDDDDEPTHTLTSYYLPTHVEGTPIIEEVPGPVSGGGGFAALAFHGYPPHHIQETVYARMPTADESARLKLPAVGEPVMILKRWTYTADDTLVEFARGVHRASKFEWTYKFNIPETSEPEEDDH